MTKQQSEKVAGETPLNARQWLKSNPVEFLEFESSDLDSLVRLCEGYARAVLAEAERALRERADKEQATGANAIGYKFGLREAADLLAGMRGK